MHDLPFALIPLVNHGVARPSLHRRMILRHPREAPKPVGESQVATHGDTEVPRFCLEGGREVRQARLPSAAEVFCPSGLEWWFRIEDDDLRGVVGHESIQVFGTQGTGPISDELSNLGLGVCIGVFRCHRGSP